MENYIEPSLMGLPSVMPPAVPVMDPDAEEFFLYVKASVRIKILISDWGPIRERAILNRKKRYLDLNVEEMRQKGVINEDETFTPDRIIDTNILRETPDYISFLKQSHRLAIFKCIDDPRINTTRLEDEFTEGMTYKGWYRPFKRLVDGASLHGWAAVEVMFDMDKPLHVGFEYVANDRLFWNLGVNDIQNSEYVVREYDVSIMQLESFVKNFGFDEKQVSSITQKTNAGRRKRDEIVKIYKIMFKYQDCVYVSWYSQDAQQSDWLKAPEKLKMGVYMPEQQMPQMMPTDGMQDPNMMAALSAQMPPQRQQAEMDMYPYFVYIYKDDEQECVIEHKGRAFLDEPTQEATTAITTAFVNGTVRASDIYASPDKENDETSGEISQLNVQLVHGGIYNQPLRFFHMPPPDPSMLSSLNFLSSRNAQQSGKVDMAVINRKDSRKTAQELKQAEGETEKISSTNISDFSEYLRDVFGFTWVIVRSQAEANEIFFMLIEKPNTVMFNGQEVETGGTSMVNDIETLSHPYDVRPSGDVDVIQRAETLANMQNDWPVVQNTPLAPKFMLDFVSLRYPQQASTYRKILEEGDPGKNLVSALATLLQGFASPEEVAALTPEAKQQLIMIQQQVQAYLGNGEQQPSGGPVRQQPQVAGGPPKPTPAV